LSNLGKQRIAARSRLFQLHSEVIAATTEAGWKDSSPYEQRLLTETEEPLRC
jgi:hypothetical protein